MTINISRCVNISHQNLPVSYNDVNNTSLRLYVDCHVLVDKLCPYIRLWCHPL